MKNKKMAKEYHINIDSFKYADLLTCEWFVYVDKRTTIYFVDNLHPPAWCKETVLSYVLRKMKLKKYISFGKPKTLPTIEPHLEPLFKEEKEIPDFRIVYSKPLEVTQASWDYDKFLEGNEMQKYDKIRNEMSRLGFIETRHPYLFKFELGDSYMAWCKQTNSSVPIIDVEKYIQDLKD